ncbi:MAG: hypothetical protein OEV80_13400, partial [candidate division Zixibacteria bacterium]|nr:hypothetical protein [candidate division Zixibacteria bacterium]
MRRPVILILFGLGMASVLPSCTQQQLSRESVIEVLDSIEHKLQWVDYRISEEQWAYNTNGFSDSLQFFGHLYDRLVLTDPAYDLLRRGSSLLNDEVDARRAQLVLSRLQLARIEAHPELIALRESSNEQRLQAKPFRRNPLDHLFASEDYGALKDPARRQSSFIVGLSSDPQREKTMGRLVRLRNQLARREGYNNFFALSAAGLRIEVPAYLQLLDQLEQASRETYSDMLEGLDSGPDGRPVEIWDIGLLLQHEAERELERYFPQDSQFTFVHRTFDSLGFSL